MNKLSGADVRRLSNLPFLKARLKVCLFACVGNHFPCFRLHCLPSLLAAELTFSNTRSLLDCRSKSGGEFRYNLHTLIVSRILGERSHRSHSESQRPFWQAGQGSADGTNRTRTKNSRISTLSPFVTMVTVRARVPLTWDKTFMTIHSRVGHLTR